MSFLWFLSDLRTPAGDFFFQQITYLGQEIFVVAVICWLYWCVSKKSAYILGFSYFLSGLLIQALKITFRVPRPWKLDSSFKAVESALPEATGYSFPSGHTQSITALFGTLALSARKKWQTVLCFSLIIQRSGRKSSPILPPEERMWLILPKNNVNWKKEGKHVGKGRETDVLYQLRK